MTFIGLVLSGHNRGPKNIRVLIIILTLTMARVRYTTIIQKFREKGEKSGWTYIDVPADVANRLKKGQRTSFRVKGKLDDSPIEKVALIPIGNGDFILPLNAALRKAIGKREGAGLTVDLQLDESVYQINADLRACLEEEPAARKIFDKLPGSHQRYYSKWIDGAKTEVTRARRIATTIDGMIKGWSFAEILRNASGKK